MVQIIHSPLVDILRDCFLSMVRSNVPDMTSRQLAIFLICGLDQNCDHTVRGLAAKLDLSRPTVTRSIDRLQWLYLMRRKPDPADRRSVLVEVTSTGRAFLKQLQRTMVSASAAAKRRATVG